MGKTRVFIIFCLILREDERKKSTLCLLKYLEQDVKDGKHFRITVSCINMIVRP